MFKRTKRITNRGIPRVLIFILAATLLGLVVNLTISGIVWHRHGFEAGEVSIIHRSQKQLHDLYQRDKSVAFDVVQSEVGLLGRLQHAEKDVVNDTKERLQHGILFHDKSQQKMVKQGETWFDKLLNLGVLALAFLVLKWLTIFVSFWVYVFAAMIGIVDGLLIRLIRKREGGREYAYRYHYIADHILKVPLYLWALYLIIPFSINPELVVCLSAITIFGFCYMLTANLKKYI